MTELLGWLGVAIVVLAYFLVSTRRVNGDGLGYQLMNVVGSVFLIVNFASQSSWQGVVINTVWVTIGLYTIFKK